MEGVGYLSLMTGGRVAICGPNELLIYSLNAGQMIWSLEGRFTGMTEVSLTGRVCLAISIR